jgi:hypothetical protein
MFVRIIEAAATLFVVFEQSFPHNHGFDLGRLPKRCNAFRAA